MVEFVSIWMCGNTAVRNHLGNFAYIYRALFYDHNMSLVPDDFI